VALADLNELAVFVRVAQLGSFSGAARSMGMPVSTVSRRVKALEARLGVSLIKRTTRKLSLSEHGLRFYERCAPHLEGLDSAEAGLTEARGEIDGLLQVTAPVALGAGEFTDFISGFMRRHPKVRINLVITNELVDLVSAPIDVAIRFGELSDSGAIAKRLGTTQRVLVASPAYLQKHGTPRSPQDLRDHDCVLFPGKTDGAEWLLQDGRHRVRIPVTGPVIANNLESANAFAIRGHGVALLPEPYVIAGAAAGSLARILRPWMSAPIPVHAVYLNRKFVPAKLQTFLNELTTWKNATWRKFARTAS
jgi:DNA-binding transcriptional LysR family regulator